jgi:hypothetical protein
MTYQITTSEIFERGYSAERDYEAIIDMMERSENALTLLSACEMQAESYAKQFDSEDSEFEAYWDVKWATKEFLLLVTKEIKDDATRLWLFSGGEFGPHPDFKHIRDQQLDDEGGWGVGLVRIVVFDGEEFGLLISEDEDSIVPADLLGK